MRYQEIIEAAGGSASGFPVKKLAKVYHVGTLNLKDKAGDSYEGAGVSISLDPFAWVKIARIGGSPLWVAEKKRGQFLDSAKLSEDHRSTMAEWAVSAELVKNKPDGIGITLAHAMRQRMMVPKATDAGYLRGLIAVAYAEDVIQLDGVWWNIRTQGLHAPRGVIVPSKVTSWNWTKKYDDYP
jgi:hypothetical protein